MRGYIVNLSPLAVCIGTEWFCGHMRGYIVNLSPCGHIFGYTDFGHMMVIWWNRVSWLYLWSYEIRVGENGSLVR